MVEQATVIFNRSFRAQGFRTQPKSSNPGHAQPQTVANSFSALIVILIKSGAMFFGFLYNINVASQGDAKIDDRSPVSLRNLCRGRSIKENCK